MEHDLTWFAQQDCRRAREEGSILVTGTKQGLVEVSYRDGVYAITVQGADSKVLYRGAAKGCRAQLAGIYTVECI